MVGEPAGMSVPIARLGVRTIIPSRAAGAAMGARWRGPGGYCGATIRAARHVANGGLHGARRAMTAVIGPPNAQARRRATPARAARCVYDPCARAARIHCSHRV